MTTITSAEFHKSNPVLIPERSMRRGSGPMAMSAIDVYKTDLGEVTHHWSMGGETYWLGPPIPEVLGPNWGGPYYQVWP